MLTLKTAALARIMVGLFALMFSSAVSAADLSVTQYSAAPDPIASTAQGTFTVTVANNSAPAVNNAVVTIAISPNFEVINAPANFPAYCTLSGAVGSQTLICNMPNLLGGGTANAQTFTYRAIARGPGAGASTARIAAAGNSDANPGNDALTINPTVRAGADLSITKSGSAPSVIAGGILQYTLTVSNSGPNSTSAVRVLDNLPAASDFAFQSATGSGWSCSQSGTQVTCNYSGAAPAVNTPYPNITITGRITKASAGTISNIASVTGTDPQVLDPVGSNNTSNVVVTNIEAGSDLQAIKSMPSTITVGSSANIVLTIRNTGPQNVPTASTITDTINASLTIGTLPSGCTRSGQIVTCTAGTLTATGQTNFTIPVVGASATSGIINNSATVAPPAGFADPDFGNNIAIAPFQVVLPNADLELRSKSKSPNPVAPGANVTSTIVVRNLGPSVASYSPTNPIRVTDTLSANETFVSVSGPWSCSVSGVVVTCATTGTGSLNVGSELTLSLVTRAGAGTDATITNTACTDTTAGSAHTPSSAASPTGNDCRSAGVRSTTLAADLTVAKDVSLSPTGGWTENLAISDADTVFYVRLRVSNAAGGDLARTVSVTDALPNFINSGGFVTGVTQQSATSGSLAYTASNGLATWSLSNLAGGGSQTMVIRVARPFESGSFTNFASVFSPDTTELNTGNNTDSAAYTITGISDMTINSKSVTPNPARVGVQSTYIISVRNDGANPANNVVVRDVIDPDKFEIIGTPTTTKPGGTCSVVIATGTVTCPLGQFTRTEVRQINVQVIPKYPFGGATLASLPAANTNQATVTTDTQDSNGGTDPLAGNNFFNLNHTMNAPTFDLSVTKQESNPATDDPVRFDETLNYDIRASNFGPSRATDVLITDIPSPPPGLTMTLSSVTINPIAANGGLTLQAAPNAGCVPSGANVLCRIDTTSTANNYLNSQSQVIFRLSFTMGGTAPSTIVTFANAAELTSAEQPVWNGAGADVQTANNRAVQNTTVLPSTDLEVVSKTRTGALQRSVNEPIEFAIRFRNNGPATAARVRITDVLPAGFVYSATPAPSTSIPGGSSATVSGLTCSGTSTIVCDIDGTFPVGAAHTVDLLVNTKAQAPYSGALTPMDATDTATITPGLDAFGDPLSEDANGANNSQSAVVQIRASSIAGSVYADNNNNSTFDGGEGMTGVQLTLTGTDIFGNAIMASVNTNGSGAFNFGVLPPSNASGYTIVETQPITHYDLNETAGSAGGTVNNGAYGNTAAENTISAIVLTASTDATGYIFQDHLRATIIATNDNPPSVVGAVGQTNLTNAFNNDSLNGAAIVPANITTTITTPASNAGVTMDTATGQVSVAAGTPAATYTIVYQICDLADPTNCATATVTVIVTAASISATNDTIGGISGATGAADVLSALTGDLLNGAAATTANVTIALAPGATIPAGLTFDISDGTTSVQPNTPAGNYSFNYQICEQLNPTNCAIATETVSVIAGPIQSVNDSATGINGASGANNVLNVLTGDTRNGVPATTGEVTIQLAPGATVPAGLTFDTATGNVSVVPGTPAGTYFFNYRICEIINPTNCSIAEARVTVVAAPIIAVDDSVGGINGTDGANDVLNALTDDTINGVAATTANVSIALAPGATVPAGLTFDTATGNTSVDPGTAAGSYSFDYQICELLNPGNCAIATETVTVVAAPILAVDDSASGINGADGANDVLNVLGDDTLNGNAATIGDVTITVATGFTVPAGLSFNPATGNVSVDPGTSAGTYSFDYTICEQLNPTNCSTATATVTVDAAPIAAVSESVGGINGASGANDVLNALDGDTLNGVAATTGTVSIAVAPASTVPAGLSFDTATGNVSVDPGTAAGTYSFDYQICELLNPTNCAIATETVTVVAAPITADRDAIQGINGATGQDDVLDALDGDTLNGAPATLATVTVSLAPGATVPAGLTFDTADGTTSVLPGTPAGIYSFNYQICEILNPTNCAIHTESVEVVAAPILAVDDNANGINGATGASNVLNVLSDDTLNNAAAEGADVTITVATGSTVPAGLTFDPASGNISVDPATRAGTYSFNYTICENLNPTNCSTATATVEVVAPPMNAVDDSVGGINGTAGASDVLNVLGSDTLNGNPATTGNVTITVATGSTVPAGLTFDPASGNITVDPGSPAGPYSFDYTICEQLNPTNCRTATATVTVVAGPITADDDSSAAVNGADGANGVVDALIGDTLDGAPADLADITMTVVTPATSIGGNPVPVLNTATGLVDVPAGTPAGTYTINYQICEDLNPTNCAAATITVPVNAANITAVNDNVAGINGADGGTDVLNALTGDTLNGVAATTGTVSIALAPGATVPAGLSFDIATGNVSVDAGTPAGTYSFDYQICELLNPTNCAIATETVEVVAAPIVAVSESVSDINGATGANDVLNALDGDTLNGVAATTGTVSIAVAPGATVPAGLSFDTATGNVSVDAGTPAGTYSFDYQICELLNPTNCAIATETVTVVAAPIVAVDDSVVGINGSDGAPNVLNVLGDDTLNGAPADPSTMTITVATGSSVPAGLSFDPNTGSVSVDPNTPAGTYTFDYTICEILNPTNCSTATATVTVDAAPIVAVSESVSDINGATGAADVLNALSDDTLNGVAATTGTVSIAVAPGATVPAGLTFDTAIGDVSVDAGTPAGTYSFDYQICELLNPTNCAIATETVTVVAAPIVAVNDDVAGINGTDGASDVLNVLDGDTLNGDPVDTTTVTITVATGSTVPAGLTFDPNTGSVSVDPNTPAGTYTFDYTICEILNPTNCSTATATVTVDAAPIVATPDTAPPTNGGSGGTDVINVLPNDTLNGDPVDPTTVTVTVTTPATPVDGGPVPTLDPTTGNVDVPAGTPAGDYVITYEICEQLNPTNCAATTVTVPVTAAPIAAVDDTVTGINGISGAADVLNVLDGDTLDGNTVDTTTVTIAVATGSTVPAGLTFDPATGNVSVDPNTPAGNYTFDYTICEILNPTNCSTATASVTVDAAPIVATPDTAPPSNGGSGEAGVINVLPNDTLGGDPVDPTTVTVTVTTPATPVDGGPVPALNPATGDVDVPPGTPVGDYEITYEICEILNPTNCATTTVTVPVTAGPIEAVDDTVVDIIGADGGTDVLNVLTGDTLNGVPATIDNVTISVAPGSTVPAGLTFDPATGSVSVDPNTPAGDYSFDYEICEILNSTNCTTATVTVTVVAAPIDAVDDTAGDVNSSTGQPDVLNVFDGDTINGNPATPANSTVTLAPSSVVPTGITFDTATGSVGVAPNTPEGTYTFDYELCELLNPTNCTTATVTITVLPPRSAVNGIVYLDDNLNRSRETGEELQVNWIVNLIRDGDVVETTTTDTDGFYAFEDILSGGGYSIQFIHPTTGTVFGVINDVDLPVNGTLNDQNLPIDPSGVVYDAITRNPVSGAVVTLVDASGTPLPTVCYLDPSQTGQVTAADGYYRFDIVAGADAACPVGRTEYRLQVTAPTGYADPVSTVIGVESGSLNVSGLGNPAPVVPNNSAPQGGEPTTYYLGFLIAAGDANVVNNHIPLDPFLSRTPLLVTKTSTTLTASTGDLVPYTITVRNTEAAARAAVNVIDILPPGFKYVPGSSRVDEIAFEPTVANRELRWENQTFAGNQLRTYQIVAVIGAGVTEGDRINTAVGRSGVTGTDISNRAQAVVSIVPSAIFDCAEIIGKVFDDLNGDGYQNDGEPGIPGARVATVNGQLITTDEYGRYHITCAAVPDAQIGSNFVLKLDTRTIPAGYSPTSDNPQSIRLTRGKISELNFGVQKARVVSIVLDTRAFQAGGSNLNQAFAAQLNGLTEVEAQRLVIQITYSASTGENTELVQARLAVLKRMLEATFEDDDDWDGPPPTIETNMVRANVAPGRE
jgi:uncharacterized repeat protein (TIGR01451 family)